MDPIWLQAYCPALLAHGAEARRQLRQRQRVTAHAQAMAAAPRIDIQGKHLKAGSKPSSVCPTALHDLLIGVRLANWSAPKSTWQHRMALHATYAGLPALVSFPQPACEEWQQLSAFGGCRSQTRLQSTCARRWATLWGPSRKCCAPSTCACRRAAAVSKQKAQSAQRASCVLRCCTVHHHFATAICIWALEHSQCSSCLAQADLLPHAMLHPTCSTALSMLHPEPCASSVKRARRAQGAAD